MVLGREPEIPLDEPAAQLYAEEPMELQFENTPGKFNYRTPKERELQREIDDLIFELEEIWEREGPDAPSVQKLIKIIQKKKKSLRQKVIYREMIDRCIRNLDSADYPDLEYQEDLTETEILQRHAYKLTFGFDIKLVRGKDGVVRPMIIEINGKYAGSSGAPENADKTVGQHMQERQGAFAQTAMLARKSDVIFRAPVDPLHREKVENILAEKDIPIDNMQMYHPFDLDVQFMEIIKDGEVHCVPVRGPKAQRREDEFGEVSHHLIDALHPGAPRQEGLQASVFQRQPAPLERVLEHKILQKELIPEQMRVPYGVWNTDAQTDHSGQIMPCIQELWEEWNTNPHLPDLNENPQIVLKTPGGAHGDNVKICAYDDRTQIEDFVREQRNNFELRGPQFDEEGNPVEFEILIEPFLPSIDIDGHTDGCARCFLDEVVWWEDGQPHNATATNYSYWRISPGAVKGAPVAGQTPESMGKANKTGTNPAISHEMSGEHKEVCREAMQQTLQHMLGQWGQFDPIVAQNAHTLSYEECKLT